MLQRSFIEMQPNSRISDTSGDVGQLPGAAAPANGRSSAESEWRLVVNVNAIATGVRQRDDIDIVRWLVRSWLDSRWLDQTRETFAVALDCGINPIGYWNRWSSLSTVSSAQSQHEMASLMLTYGNRVSTSLASSFLNGGAASVATNKAPRSADVAVPFILNTHNE